jgi:hypothetical protein
MREEVKDFFRVAGVVTITGAIIFSLIALGLGAFKSHTGNYYIAAGEGKICIMEEMSLGRDLIVVPCSEITPEKAIELKRLLEDSSDDIY